MAAQLTLDDLRADIDAIIRRDAEASLMNSPVWYGEEYERPSTFPEVLVKVVVRYCDPARWGNEDRCDFRRFRMSARLAQYIARKDEAKALETIAKRRERSIQRKCVKLRATYEHRAVYKPISVFHPAIPHPLRVYVQTQLGKHRAACAKAMELGQPIPEMNPVTRLWLYLQLRECKAHYAEFGTAPLDGKKWNQLLPLVASKADLIRDRQRKERMEVILGLRSAPQKARRKALRALQQEHRDELKPVADEEALVRMDDADWEAKRAMHQSGEFTDNRADSEYFGLPTRGVLIVDKLVRDFEHIPLGEKFAEGPLTEEAAIDQRRHGFKPVQVLVGDELRESRVYGFKPSYTPYAVREATGGGVRIKGATNCDTCGDTRQQVIDGGRKLVRLSDGRTVCTTCR